MISVIIPVFNASNTIERCVDSLLRQTVSIDRIILIDDGSYDSSGLMCDEYARLYDCFIIIHSKNRGVSAARNIGIRMTRKGYLGFLDSDDWVEPTMYEMLTSNLKATNSDLAACGVIQETHSGSFVEEYNADEIEIITGEKRFESIISTKGIRGYLCNKLYCRELIYQKLDEDLYQCEDLLFTARYLIHTSSAVYIKEPLYHYSRDNSISNQVINKRSLSLCKAYERVLSIYCRHATGLATIVEKNVLKIYLNLRARYTLEHCQNTQIYEMVRRGISMHWKNVIKSHSISFMTKANILLTYLFPRTMIYMKRSVLYFRHQIGVWES